jgi:hypothetical protein
LVVRERGRRDWDCLLVDWSNEAATRVVCTSVAADAPAEVLSGLRGSCEPNAARDEAWHEVAAGDACQRLALPLLRFTRRGGELPPEAERFASVVTRG